MQFPEKLFQEAISDIFDRTPASFERLCTLSDALLRPTVTAWCMSSPALNGRCCEDDIIQEIQLRMIKYVIGDFFLRHGDEPNRDSAQFRMWLFTVAKNTKVSYIRSVCRTSVTDIEPFTETIPSGDEFDNGDREDMSLTICRAISAVIGLRVGVHKILAWLTVSILVLNEDVKRSVATDFVANDLGSSTLYEMLDFLCRELTRHPYVRIAPEDMERLEELLREDCDGEPMGNRTFSDFFTSKGGNYSISDWIYKINKTIRRSL